MKIKNDSDLRNAFNRLDEIWSAKPGDADWEERCALIDQVEQYEDSTVEIPPPSPVDAILFRMEQGNLRNKDLVPYIGSAPKVSEVLAGKRNLSKEMIRKLHIGLGIPLNSLLGVPDSIPEGFAQVEWILPVDVVNSIVRVANYLKISEEELAGKMLMITIPLINKADNFVTMTEQRQYSENINSVVSARNVRPDLAA